MPSGSFHGWPQMNEELVAQFRVWYMAKHQARQERSIRGIKRKMDSAMVQLEASKFKGAQENFDEAQRELNSITEITAEDIREQSWRFCMSRPQT